MREDKHGRLLVLGRRRQQTRWPGYNSIADYHSGLYETEWVSPYTRSAHNVDADVMVLLQDWASDDVLRGPFLQARADLGHDPKRYTNIHLKQLLHEHLGIALGDTFATNVFPFVKLGLQNAPLPRRDLVRAAVEFALPQIEIVSAKIAICLGATAFNAVREAAGLRRVTTIEDGVASLFLFGTTRVLCQAHTGMLGRNNRNRGGVDRVSADWNAMATMLGDLREVR